MERKYQVKSSHRVGNELNRKLIKLIVERKEEMNWYALPGSAYGHTKAIKWIIDHNYFIILGHSGSKDYNIKLQLFYNGIVNGQDFDRLLCTTKTEKTSDSDYLELSDDVEQELISFIDKKVLSKNKHDIEKAEEVLERYVNFLDSDKEGYV